MRVVLRNCESETYVGKLQGCVAKFVFGNWSGIGAAVTDRTLYSVEESMKVGLQGRNVNVDCALCSAADTSLGRNCFRLCPLSSRCHT